MNGKKKSLGHISTNLEVYNANFDENPKFLAYTSPATYKLGEALRSDTKYLSNQAISLSPYNSFFQTQADNEEGLSISLQGSKNSTSPASCPVTESAQLIINRNKAAYLLRVAFAEGGGRTDPKKSPKLNFAIKKAQEIGVPKATIQQMIRKCKLMSEGNPVALLQIRYQRKVFTVCTVHTRSLHEFQTQLMPTLKKYFAGFAGAMHIFRSLTHIDAVVRSDIGGNFVDIERNVQRDALACGASNAKLLDYETGSFRFRVDPFIVADVVSALNAKGYKVVNTDYVLQPRSLVELNRQEKEAYENFLWILRQIPEIDRIFDNVKDSPATRVSL